MNTPNVDQLHYFGVDPGRPGAEFVDILKLRSSDELRSLLASVFVVACAGNLVSWESRSLTFVNRRDTALSLVCPRHLDLRP